MDIKILECEKLQWLGEGLYFEGRALVENWEGGPEWWGRMIEKKGGRTAR